MQVQGLEQKPEIDTSLAADVGDARMVARMRLVLSVSALLAVFVDPASLRGVGGSTWLLFCGYIVHSLVVCVYAELEAPLSQSRLIHWLDICWYVVIVQFTDGVHSAFFLFFFFAILTSSFRWGFEEGARVTLASVALFAVCGIDSATAQDLPRLLLRSTFILALGYMIIYWGRSKVELKRRLALLRAVSRLSNPRFGVDHTVTGILEKIQRFFLESSSCLLVVRDKESGACSLRTIRQGDSHRSPQAERIAPELAALLMAVAPHRAAIYRRAPWLRLPGSAGAVTYDAEKGRWSQETHPAFDGLAEMLEANAFISVPVALRKSEGRLYVLSRCGVFHRADALFLGHVVAQAFPVVENIELLDRMASDAASQERRKIALDLHDTAVQPYIGLKMGLSALRNKATADNPLVEDLDKLQDMAARVISDLRRYAGAVRNGPDRSDLSVPTLVRQQVTQVRDFYGIDIAVCVEGDLKVNDRMAAEILQIVREGLNNICKHTLAHCGAVKLACADGLLRVEIENEADGTQSIEFLPRSISERASALGGFASVRRGTGGGTSVHVEIPT
ncbi:Sensor histidine kinase LiaS [Variovorax sp. PBS-H4]|uniref:sensor histidine kinase n=1 Tax=Variovorax sp. PBS-H4 TaxID=434008 RepID=UPI0013190D88|nr:histidine kinase [Variovorax sp. PBS-H4]VTU26464.1 Sensor histidine kinase LiaS [Variovorax sp. PBS-H4]